MTLEECHSAMLQDNMNISHLIVHDRIVEETRDKRNGSNTKREISFYGGSTKKRLEIQNNPRFKKTFSTHISFKFPKAYGDKGLKF